MARGWPTRCSNGLYWSPDDTARATATRNRDETSAWQNFPSRRAAVDQVVSPNQDGDLASLLPPSPSCSGKNHSCASFRHLRPEQARSCRLFVGREIDGGSDCLHEMNATVQDKDKSSMQVSRILLKHSMLPTACPHRRQKRRSKAVACHQARVRFHRIFFHF